MVVEGVRYRVNWREFHRGSSVFFPCLDPKLARYALRREMKTRKLKTVNKVTVEDGIMGLRVWRV
jgi:hypothetical protein